MPWGSSRYKLGDFFASSWQPSLAKALLAHVITLLFVVWYDQYHTHSWGMLYINYRVERSRVGGEVGLLKSPFRLKPGAFVELRTCCTISQPHTTDGADQLTTSCTSLLILSLNWAMSFFTFSTKALIFRCISSGVKPSWPTAILTTPILSLYSLPPIISRTVPATSFTTVPSLTLGSRPFGPNTLPSPALFSFWIESTWHMHLSNSIRPSLTASKTVSSPTTEAPALMAAFAIAESGGQMTQIRIEVFTGWGSCIRLRIVGPFLSVRSLRCISYLEDVGGRPTSKARM